MTPSERIILGLWMNGWDDPALKEQGTDAVARATAERAGVTPGRVLSVVQRSTPDERDECRLMIWLAAI